MAKITFYNFISVMLVTAALTTFSSHSFGCDRREGAVFDPAKLDDMRVALNDMNFHSVLVFKNAEMIFEEYFRREDELFGLPLGVVNFDADTLHDLRSGTKSVVALLIGIAIIEGHIPSEYMPIKDLLNEYDRSVYHDHSDGTPLTLADVLTMQAGLDWNEAVSYADPRNPGIQMWQNEHPATFALGRDYVGRPGETYNYNGGLTQILVAILEYTTGQSIESYAQQKLFGPLGMKRFEWIKHESGQAWGPSGLRLTARDYSKIGLLVLQKGIWNDRKIVPAGWIEEMLEPRVETALPIKLSYGYHWFISGYEVEGNPVNVFMAQGNGAQTLLLFPEQDLLIAMMGGYYNDFQNMMALPHQLATDFVLPAIAGGSCARLALRKALP